MTIVEPGGTKPAPLGSKGGSSPAVGYPVWFTTMSSSPTTLRVIGTPAQTQSGWSGTDSFSVEMAAGKIKSQNGVIYAPYVVHDFKSQEHDFIAQSGGIYSREGNLFSVTALNGQKVFQPIHFGGPKGAFGAQDPLSAAERADLAVVISRQFHLAPNDPKHWFGDPKVRADAARYLLANWEDRKVAEVMKGAGKADSVLKWAEAHKDLFTADELTKLKGFAQKVVAEEVPDKIPKIPEDEPEKKDPEVKPGPFQWWARGPASDDATHAEGDERL